MPFFSTVFGVTIKITKIIIRTFRVLLLLHFSYRGAFLASCKTWKFTLEQLNAGVLELERAGRDELMRIGCIK